MRNTLLALMLSAAGLAGLAATPSTAQAEARVYVDFGDVSFYSGRPYYRHDRSPLYVSYDRHGHPRYYRNGPRYGHRVRHYDPYYDNRVIVRPRVVYRDSYRDGYRDHHYRGGHRNRYWVDHHGRRHYYRY